MSERSPYSRVYWTIRNDPRLADIYPSDAFLATWTRLLIAADMSWPAPADLPASVRRSSLTALCAAGVIELLPGGLFRFHGLDSERGRRREAAQASAARRTGTGREASGDQTGTGREPNGLLTRASPGVAEPSRDRDEPSRADAPADAREGTDPIDAYFVKTNRVPRAGALDFLNRLAGEYGDPLLCESLATVDADPMKDFLSRVELRLTHVLEGAKAAPPNGRASPEVTPEEDAERRRIVAEQTGVTPESIAAGRAAMAALPHGRTRGLSRIGGEA